MHIDVTGLNPVALGWGSAAEQQIPSLYSFTRSLNPVILGWGSAAGQQIPLSTKSLLFLY